MELKTLNLGMGLSQSEKNKAGGNAPAEEELNYIT